MTPKDELDHRTAKEIERFLHSLKDHASRTRESIRRARTQRCSTEQVRAPDVMDWASDTLEDEMQVALVDRLSQQVSQIDAALERLTRREYGLCHDCDEFIGLARLKALPFAQRCTRCQTRAEKLKAVREPRPLAAILALEDED